VENAPTPPNQAQIHPRAKCQANPDFLPGWIGAFHRAISAGRKSGEGIESLGRVLLQFYRAVNLLYRKVEGKQPEWVARWLDLGKPPN
jgi:hypothetical protein